MRIQIGLVWCLAFLALAVRVHGTIWNNGLSTEEFMRENDYIPFASSTAPYFAVLQTDGNFCIYSGNYRSAPTNPVWCSGVVPGTGQYFAILQTDSNFCVYSGTGPSNNHGLVWCSMALNNGGSYTLTLGYCGVLTAQSSGVTYWSTPADFASEATCRPPNSGIAWPNGLTTGQFMRENDYIPFASSSSPYFAVLQSDGHFCIYSGTYPTSSGTVVWCSSVTPGTGQYFAMMQADSNFCVYRGTGPSDNHGYVWCSMALNSGGSYTLTLGYCGVLTTKSSGVTYWSTPADYAAEATCRPPNSGVARVNGLATGDFMRENDYIPFLSSTAPYFAVLQSDGHFCVYSGNYPTSSGTTVWCSSVTPGTGQYFAMLQTDGNFCVYSGTGPSNNHGYVWCSMALNGSGTLTLGACGVLATQSNGFTYWTTPAAPNCHP